MANSPVSVRFSDENRAWLDARAERDDRSLNYLINKIVEGMRLAEMAMAKRKAGK